MAIRYRNKHIHIMVTEEEYQRILLTMHESGYDTMRKYLCDMALYGVLRDPDPRDSFNSYGGHKYGE